MLFLQLVYQIFYVRDAIRPEQQKKQEEKRAHRYKNNVLVPVVQQ